MSPRLVTPEWINDVRTHYGLVGNTPIGAALQWAPSAAPSGAVEALGYALLEVERLHGILAALREPSEGMMAAVLNPNATAGVRLAVRFVLDAAVAFAEQEVGGR